MEWISWILKCAVRKTPCFYNLNVNPAKYTPFLNNVFYCFPTDSVSLHAYGRLSASIVVMEQPIWLKITSSLFKASSRKACYEPVSTLAPVWLTGQDTLQMHWKSGFENYSFNAEKSSEFAPREQFHRLLAEEASGTFLDTIYGRSLREYVTTLYEDELCKPLGVFLAYGTCAFLADHVTTDTKFNILQYAHQLLPTWYHGTRCTNLNVFKTCWKSLQTICGEVTRGVRLHATLLAQACTIRDMMEKKACKWQDMLVGPYIESSKKSIWPIVMQLPGNAFQLEGGMYSADVGEKLWHAIQLLQPGVDEIAVRCGEEAAFWPPELVVHTHKNSLWGQQDWLGRMGSSG